MTVQDLWLLSPELSLAFLAGLLFVLDLVLERKGVLAVIALVGLLLPLAFSVLLWGEVAGWLSVLAPLPDEEPGRAIPGLFGTLVVDRFALFFKFLFLIVVGMVILASTDYVAKLRQLQGEYYVLILVSTLGMLLLAAATELLSLYVALELTALPLAALAAFLRDSRSTEAGIKFLLLSGLSSAVLLYGMALTFGLTGSTELKEVAAALRGALGGDIPFGSYTLLAGATLMVAGFGFKIASVPFQMWVPDVYEGAPTPITAFLSVASKAAGFAVILRVFYAAFGSVDLDWGALFAVLSIASMTLGNLVAIAQRNIKRMLAYSTIAHAGYLMVGVAAVSSRTPDGTTFGPEALLFYLAAYAATNLAAFFAVIAFVNQTSSEMIDSFAGMGRRSPWLAALLAFSLVSLTGIPPTAGFMGKLFLFSAAVKSELAWLAVVGVLNSVVSAYYYLRVIRVMYFQPPPTEERGVSSVPLRVALGSAALGVAFLGLAPWPVLYLAHRAALALSP